MPRSDGWSRSARAQGLKLAGVLQQLASEDADHRCDVVLEDLASGHRTPLFENRGRGARGCRLDEAALAEATARIEGSLEIGPDLLVLSKFGKVECDGGGLRDLIAEAIDRDIPVIIGVPERNLEAWRQFAGEFAVELSEDGRRGRALGRVAELASARAQPCARRARNARPVPRRRHVRARRWAST